MKDALVHCVTHGHDTYCDLTTNGNVIAVVALLFLFLIAFCSLFIASK